MSRVSDLMNIEKILRRFKVIELSTKVISCFPHLTWESVIDELNRQKEQMTMKNIIQIFMMNIKDESALSLQSLYIHLCALDVSLYHYKRQWHAYKMERPLKRRFHLEKLYDNIIQGCRLNRMECIAFTLNRNEIIWIVLIEKKTVKGCIRKSKPICCAYILQSPYLFFHNVPSANVLNAVLHALMFQSAKKRNLVGNDLYTLHKLLKRKDCTTSPSVRQYIPDEPKVDFGGIDSTQHESRRKFAEKCYNKDERLRTLTLVGKDLPWQGISHIPDMKGKKMSCSLKISSSNIFSTMQELMERNVINPESCSDYLKNLSETGKNIIQFKEEDIINE